MQASISNNETIKIDGGGTTATASGTVMSTTASQYAVLTWAANNGDQLTIGSATVTAPTNSIGYVFYIPPSTTVTRSSGTINASWVLFTNSP